jgi:hypothetical protein
MSTKPLPFSSLEVNKLTPAHTTVAIEATTYHEKGFLTMTKSILFKSEKIEKTMSSIRSRK